MLVRAGVALMIMMLPARASVASALPEGFVYLRDIDPTIVQDIRYATSHNFVGRPVKGYLAAECVLSEEWWHFELVNEPFHDEFDFEVSASPSLNERPAR
jgi:D-alanyl-D-alanine dipeptidase